MDIDLSVNQKNETQHLENEHGLTKTVAYIQNGKSKQRSAGAVRVARHREKKKEQGLVKIEVPASFADAIKKAGSFEAWERQYLHIPAVYAPKVRLAVNFALRFQKLHKWKRWIVLRWMGR